jgi:hypothetical integral membrane protein (TIGR02206 family)
VSRDHAAALVVTALAVAGLPLLVRRLDERRERMVRIGLAALLLASVLAYLVAETRAGRLSVWDFLPLHLCDLAIFVAAGALLTLNPLAYEVLWYWALAGTTLAIVTPDVAGGFPDWRWVAYFGLHGLVVVSAMTLTFGCGMRPRRGSSRRVFLMTVAYAALVGAVNLLTGSNFLYLSRKPAEPTLLDWLGPWPVYVGMTAMIALGLFSLLELPFRNSLRASPYRSTTR